MPKQIDWTRGVSATLDMMHQALVLGELPHRRDAITTVVGDQTVDTCRPPDTDEWETGVQRGGEWFIVEQYATRDEAESGHQRWVEAITATPAMELPNLDIWGLNDM